MILVVFVFLLYFCFAVTMSDLVHDVEAIGCILNLKLILKPEDYSRKYGSSISRVGLAGV